MRRACVLLSFLCVLSGVVSGSTLTISGATTQSTADGTGPAVDNPTLNNITDGETFTLSLSPVTAISGPGTFDLTGSALLLSVPAAAASENGFGAIILTVTANGGFDDFSLLACLAGADCTGGNALSANFRIPMGSIGGIGVPTTGLDEPHPLDLLEDGGTTDIQASILTYSNTAQTVTPEPASGLLCAVATLGPIVIRRLGPWCSLRSRRSS